MCGVSPCPAGFGKEHSLAGPNRGIEFLHLFSELQMAGVSPACVSWFFYFSSVDQRERRLPNRAFVVESQTGRHTAQLGKQGVLLLLLCVPGDRTHGRRTAHPVS